MVVIIVIVVTLPSDRKIPNQKQSADGLQDPPARASSLPFHVLCGYDRTKAEESAHTFF